MPALVTLAVRSPPRQKLSIACENMRDTLDALERVSLVHRGKAQKRETLGKLARK